MNIEQIKTDMENGVIVSRSTFLQLADLALRQQEALKAFVERSDRHDHELAVHSSCLIAEGSGWVYKGTPGA